MAKRAIALEIFKRLRTLGLIRYDGSWHDLMTELRITRAKATHLLFDLEVRRVGGPGMDLDLGVREALLRVRPTRGRRLARPKHREPAGSCASQGARPPARLWQRFILHCRDRAPAAR